MPAVEDRTVSPYLLVPLVFVLSAGTDYLWARYTSHVAGKRARAAATFAAALMLVSGISFAAYLESRLYFVPAAAGCALGTYVAVKRDHA